MTQTRSHTNAQAPANRLPKTPAILGAGIGLLAGAVALGVGQFAAGLFGGASSPIIAVGATAIDATPEWLKSFAIRTFGTHDKTVLLVGIGGVLIVAAIVLGIVSMGRPRAGVGGLLILGAIGALAAATRPANAPVDAVPASVGAATGILAFLRLRRAAGLRPSRAERARRDVVDATSPAEPPAVDRRRFLVTGAVATGLAGTTGFLGQYLVRRSDASASRDAVRIPGVVDAAPPAPTGADLRVPGLSSFITRNEDFYRVDTALFVPAVDTTGWKLTVHGMVAHPITIDYQQLLARPLIERDITLACVSNPVGGKYIGNARWTGARLKDLLDEAGVRSSATQIVSRSTDGFTVGTPTSVALDGRDSMLAIAMNGVPLPLEHGFPVRMIVPGLYGYESACKWITEIELTTFEAFSPYWVRRGWAKQVLIKTESRIDTPKRSSTLRAGMVPIAGIAWAQHRGIERIEVRIDDQAWAPAMLAEEDTVDTWRQWVYPWEAPPGTHTISVRATDGTGAVQTPASSPTFPSGATGDHTITVIVR
jgi:DMSO/TMAO reductase YedYZ molybdopterin-dependent catalytic subunit